MHKKKSVALTTLTSYATPPLNRHQDRTQPTVAPQGKIEAASLRHAFPLGMPEFAQPFLFGTAIVRRSHDTGRQTP